MRMLDRRDFMRVFSGLGFAGTLLPGVLWAEAQGKTEITKEMVDSAAAVADVKIPDEYKQMMLETLNGRTKGYDDIFALRMPNSAAPSLLFDPVPAGMKLNRVK